MKCVKPSVKPDLLYRLHPLQTLHKRPAVPEGARRLYAAWDPCGPFDRQSRHSAIRQPRAAAERHAAHHEPGGAQAGAGDACEKFCMGLKRAGVLAIELLIAQKVQIAPNLFRVEGQDDYAALKLFANIEVFDGHKSPHCVMKVSPFRRYRRTRQARGHPGGKPEGSK